MKKIRTLKLDSKQLLSLAEQTKIIAGVDRELVFVYGVGPSNNCCSAKSQTHKLSEVYYVKSDYMGMLSGTIGYAAGVLTAGAVALASGSYLAIAGGLCTMALEAMSIYNSYAEPHYESDVTTYTCISISPTIGHSVQKTTEQGIVTL